MLCTLDHPSIIKVFDYYEDSERIYMVTELCYGGDLHDKLVEKKRTKFEEQEAASII